MYVCMYVCMYECMYVFFFYLNSQVHTGCKPNYYMEANVIMRSIKKKGGGRRRTVAKQQGGQFRSKINNCTNIRAPETETCVDKTVLYFSSISTVCSGLYLTPYILTVSGMLSLSGVYISIYTYSLRHALP